ncbi:flagellar export chaperone FliS [Lacunimicrobium album]
MNPQNEYLEMSVLTAPPHRLHLIVVEAALRFARFAQAALEMGDYESLGDALSRSREMVSELLAGLKDDQQPDMIKDLRGLFVFVYRNLMEAEFSRNPTQIENAILILEKHHRTWSDLIDALGDKPLETPEEHKSLDWVM